MKNRSIALFLSLIIITTQIIPVHAQDPGQYPVYIVQDGDTLYEIAQLFGITIDELEVFNNITNPDSIFPGTTLYIPSLQGMTGTIDKKVVDLGETYDNLLSKYQMDSELFLKLNHITSPNQIYVGTPLLVLFTNNSDSRVLVSKISPSTSLLELAAINGTNTWNILNQNNRSGNSSVLPSDLIYLQSSDSTKRVSPVDPGLSDVSISPLPLKQGKTFEISVTSDKPVTLSGSLNGMPLNFATLQDGKQISLQGVSAIATTGLSTFYISGTYDDGTSFSFEQSVLLISGDYSEADPLYVDPATIDPAVVNPEEELVRSYTSKFTTDRYWSGIMTCPSVYCDTNAGFGERRNYNDGAYTSFHAGIDFDGGEGLDIYAAADGIVVYTGLLEIRGNATIIDHGWGIYTAYFHQSEINVNVGDHVVAGQVIGKVGHTGRVDDSAGFVNAGAHLHWEIWVNGVQVDPVEWLYNEYP
jgi:murein DD-endopeptidase MepM/ murein hydrolase activator NlpD